MGHLPDDLGPFPPGGVAPVGSAAPLRPRRTVEAVRRGAVRERVPRPEVTAPSTWEHIEASITDGRDTISTLALDLGGTFHASIRELREGEEASVNAIAIGSWRQCRGGVELSLDELPELGLDDYVVVYRLVRGSLVADGFQMPDGLAHQYSPCVAEPSASSSGPRLGGPSPMLARMIADGASPSEEGPTVLEASASPRGLKPVAVREESEAVSAGPIEERLPGGRVEEPGQMPVGLIEDGSSDGDVADEDFDRFGEGAGGVRAPSGPEVLSQALSSISALTQAAAGALAAERRSAAATSGRQRTRQGKLEALREENGTEEAAGADEEYADDFEGASSEADGSDSDG